MIRVKALMKVSSLNESCRAPLEGRQEGVIVAITMSCVGWYWVKALDSLHSTPLRTILVSEKEPS